MPNKMRKAARKAEERIVHFAGHRLNLDAPEGHMVERGRIDVARPGDYGADPLGDGTFRMVPSGDIVDYEERCRRLAARKEK